MLNITKEPFSAAPSTDVRQATLRLAQSFKERRWETICWLVALAMGLLHAWGRRHDSADGLAYMGADGIAYLDIGDAYLRGDWSNALNAMWSPLYSWLLGLTLYLFKPSPFWEFSVVRLLNFVIYAGALFCFAFFLRSLMRDRQRRDLMFAVPEPNILPEWAWLVFGYTLFVWTSLTMNRVSRASPDMLLSVWVYLSAGLLLRVRAGATKWPTFVAFGSILGLGYLTKTVMFPLSLVFLGVTFVLLQRTIGVRRAMMRGAVALLIFLAVASPFVIALSRAKHRFTIGESARLNYAWYVSRTTPFIHWQGDPPGSGTPIHPTRKIFASPDVYEFAAPVAGTYPPWYDPSYWYEGATLHFNLQQQLATFAGNFKDLYGFVFYRSFLVTVVLGLFLLFYQSRRGRLLITDITACWFLIVPAVTACVLYLLVNIELRYLAPFVVLLALSLLAALRLPATREARRLVSGVSLALLVTFGLSMAPSTARAAYSAVRDLLPGRAAAHDMEWQVADGLKQLGVRPGESVAVIGNAMFASWPRLARVRVVAEIPETTGNVEKFWAGNVREQAITAIARTGARVIVADRVPQWATAEGWRRIGATDHYVYLLPARKP